MFVITADQVDSRNRPDLAHAQLEHLSTAHRDHLLLPPARNAGDEIQLLTDDSVTAVSVVLKLSRNGEWSVGLGCGSVRQPLPSDVREASGEAFFAARDAVDQAKKSPLRFAVRAGGADATDVQALFDLLLILRDRRTEEGWQVYDRVGGGIRQADIAAELGVTAPAISSRMRSSNIRAEQAAVPAIARLLDRLDADATKGRR